MTLNPVKLIKQWIANYKYKKRLAEKLKKLKDQDPFIYD